MCVCVCVCVCVFDGYSIYDKRGFEKSNFLGKIVFHICILCIICYRLRAKIISISQICVFRDCLKSSQI